MNVYVIFFPLLFCAILSHSQTSNPSSNSNPASSNTSTTSTPIIPVPLKDPLSPLINSIQPLLPPPSLPPGPKYEEFQSICRTNDFDIIGFFSEATKEQRIKMIEKKITLDPASIKLKLRLLKEFIDQHKITEAEQTVQNIKSTKASDIDILIANGAFSFLKKDQKKAKDFLNKVLAEEPKNIEALKWLAEEYRSEMNYFEASAIYYDMLKISNENMNESLCEVLTLDAHYAEAEPICIKGSALKKNPFFDIYLGIAAREKMNLKEAKKYFLSSLNIKETEMGRVCLGEVFAIEKNYPEAENSYKSALKIIPESTRAQLGLAWAYFNNKERVTALESFKKACSLEKTATSELRKAIKVLIDEKSEFIQKYVNQNQRCVGS